MARDARVGRDRVLVENYFQHAEHYQRLANEILEAQNQAGEAAQNSSRRSNGVADGAPSGQETAGNPSGADGAGPKESESATVNGSGQDAQPAQDAQAGQNAQAAQDAQPERNAPAVKGDQGSQEEQKPPARRRRAPRTPQPDVKAEAVEAEAVEVPSDQGVNSDQEEVPPAEAEAAS